MHNATEILDQAEQENEYIYDNIRDAADWFHDNEGEMFKRDEARDLLADDLNVDEDVAQSLIAELVGDDVDPITQAKANGKKYIGVAEFKEFDGAYGYLDYHDLHGKRKRVICAQCVHNATYDTEVTHATAGDPDGSFSPQASYDELLSGIHDHYKDSHDEIPETVETGASLVSGTTIGGNTAWHAGNDGSGSGLDADTLDGKDAENLGGEMIQEVGEYNASSTVTTVDLSNTYSTAVLVAYVWDNGGDNIREVTEPESWNTNSNGDITSVTIDYTASYNDHYVRWIVIGEAA